MEQEMFDVQDGFRIVRATRGYIANLHCLLEHVRENFRRKSASVP